MLACQVSAIQIAVDLAKSCISISYFCWYFVLLFYIIETALTIVDNASDVIIKFQIPGRKAFLEEVGIGFHVKLTKGNQNNENYASRNGDWVDHEPAKGR